MSLRWGSWQTFIELNEERLYATLCATAGYGRAPAQGNHVSWKNIYWQRRKAVEAWFRPQQRLEQVRIVPMDVATWGSILDFQQTCP